MRFEAAGKAVQDDVKRQGPLSQERGATAGGGGSGGAGGTLDTGPAGSSYSGGGMFGLTFAPPHAPPSPTVSPSSPQIPALYARLTIRSPL